jgi:hypothetical protein
LLLNPFPKELDFPWNGIGPDWSLIKDTTSQRAVGYNKTFGKTAFMIVKLSIFCPFILCEINSTKGRG